MRLNRIYTGGGDQGETGLGDGTRVRKDDPCLRAIGAVDEVNSLLGLCIAMGAGADEARLLHQIQHDLFDLGADLCRAETNADRERLRIQPEQVQRLEEEIDVRNTKLNELRSFVLPGGSVAAAWFHLARTVCRRAERDVVTLSNSARINPRALVYLNRLSDLLFVLARASNNWGSADVLWEPGKNQDQACP